MKHSWSLLEAVYIVCQKSVDEQTDSLINLFGSLESVGRKSVGSFRVIFHSLVKRLTDENTELPVGHGSDQRPAATTGLQAAQKRFMGRREENGSPRSIHDLHIVEKAGRSASACHDHILKLAHLPEHASLQIAETVLAPRSENVADIRMITLLYIGIKINELHAGGAAERSSERRFAATHEAD